MQTPSTGKVLDLIRETGVLRSRDLDRDEIPRASSQRLVRRGEVERVGRGLYMLPDAAVTEHHSLVEACKRVPQRFVCLLSALRFEAVMTDHEPKSQRAEAPAQRHVPVAVVEDRARFRGPVLEALGKNRGPLDDVGDAEDVALEVGEHPLVG